MIGDLPSRMEGACHLVMLVMHAIVIMYTVRDCSTGWFGTRCKRHRLVFLPASSSLSGSNVDSHSEKTNHGAESDRH